MFTGRDQIATCARTGTGTTKKRVSRGGAATENDGAGRRRRQSLTKFYFRARIRFSKQLLQRASYYVAPLALAYQCWVFANTGSTRLLQDNANLSRIVREIATVAGTIGAVEDLLLVAKRPRARVAIVAPRSSCYWDAWEGVGAKGNPPTLVGVTSSLMALSEVYTAEVFAL